MTTRVYKNFVEGTLASSIAAVDTASMSVTFATNATVPVSSDFSSKHIYFVIDPEGAEHAPEIVKGTAISGSGPYSIAITRSQNGTSAQVWDSGRKVVAALIEEDITNFATKDGTTFTGNVTVGANTAGHDVKFFGNSDGHYMWWDASADELVFPADTKISFYDAAGGEKIQAASDGHLNIDAGTTLDFTAPTIDLNASTEVNIDGDVDLNGALDISGTAGTSNLQITFAEGYEIYADNTTTGGGSANSRIWFEAPNGGELVLGPRTSGHKLHNMRLRATTIAAEGILDIADTTDASDATGNTGALRTIGGASIAKKLYVGTDLDVDGTANFDGIVLAGNMSMTGDVFGANPIVKVAYKAASGSADVANDHRNNPVIYICNTDPASGSDSGTLTNGDIWINL